MLVFGQPNIGNKEISEVINTLKSGWLGTGPKVERFEKLICKYKKIKNTIAVNSCTAALHLSLLAIQLKKGEENIYLTEGESKLLNYLAINNNDIVLREELAGNKLNDNEFRNIDVQVTRLRQKVEKNPKQPIYIKTIRGKGYKLITN